MTVSTRFFKMNDKFSLLVALLFAVTSVVSAASVSEDTLHTLAICFLVLCIIVLIIAIILPIVLYRRRVQQETKGYTVSSKGSMYNLSARQRKISEGNKDKEPNYYGIYHDPQPANSIYLPLEKRIEENGNYAHLEGSKASEDPHAYEELKEKGTFGGATYDNPVATAGDDDDDHDYEVADATIVRPKSRDYDNPQARKADTAF